MKEDLIKFLTVQYVTFDALSHTPGGGPREPTSLELMGVLGLLAILETALDGQALDHKSHAGIMGLKSIRLNQESVSIQGLCAKAADLCLGICVREGKPGWIARTENLWGKDHPLDVNPEATAKRLYTALIAHANTMEPATGARFLKRHMDATILQAAEGSRRYGTARIMDRLIAPLDVEVMGEARRELLARKPKSEFWTGVARGFGARAH